MTRTTSPSAGKKNTITVHKKKMLYELRWNLGGHFLYYFTSILCYCVPIWRPLQREHFKTKRRVASTSRREPMIHIAKEYTCTSHEVHACSEPHPTKVVIKCRFNWKCWWTPNWKIKSTCFLRSYNYVNRAISSGNHLAIKTELCIPPAKI